MRAYVVAALALLGGAILCYPARSPEIAFERKTIDLGVSETCAIGDFNNDGRPDIFSGDAWYENPSWKRHEVRHLKEYGTYLASLTDLAIDVDGDGLTDIVSSGWHSGKIWWSRNPGKAGAIWEDHPIDQGAPVEFSFLVDLDNDGKARELLPQFGSKSAGTVWYDLAGGHIQKHVVSQQAYGHGIGAGDVNGDGRNDIITPAGWFEAPPDPRAGEWKFHQEFDLGSVSFIYVLDINEDGLPDLLTAHGHDYGIFWMEQRRDHTWVKHVIDESWSQAHALTLVDLNGDGRKDLLTGKRFMAHDGHDPGEHEPLGIYWYEYHKSEDGKEVVWSRHIIDYGSRAGGGMQIPVADIDGDGDLDFAVGGKSGLFLFENLTRGRRMP
ncbi:MAG TPA: VCBS repeat-containing protein [Candidatus Sulfopaludibacter sp.]|nr:VCBS repeat-containing protein [Candidatus Sulfopaludibacter sp.]